MLLRRGAAVLTAHLAAPLVLCLRRSGCRRQGWRAGLQHMDGGGSSGELEAETALSQICRMQPNVQEYAPASRGGASGQRQAALRCRWPAAAGAWPTCSGVQAQCAAAMLPLAWLGYCALRGGLQKEWADGREQGAGWRACAAACSCGIRSDSCEIKLLQPRDRRPLSILAWLAPHLPA